MDAKRGKRKQKLLKLKKKRKSLKITSRDEVSIMNGWVELEVHDDIVKGLMDEGLTSPTDIQREAIPPAIRRRDIVGAAETVGAMHQHVTICCRGLGKLLPFPFPYCIIY
jgi:superfamily II DNA/RNA helicase